MQRRIILKNTVTGQELTLPVTPASYPMAAGRNAETLDMAQTGQVTLPGLRTLFNETIEGMFPARLYPFCAAGAVADPRYYIGLITQWSDQAQVCRYIVDGTGINRPVLLGPLSYGESDGSNDVNYSLPIREYRYLEEAAVEEATGNSARPSEAADQPQSAQRYTVEKGDCLWTICRRIYGDGSLAYRLASVNDIRNPDLIYPGQVLELPDKAALSAVAAAAPAAGTSRETTEEARDKARAALGLGGGTSYALVR